MLQVKQQTKERNQMENEKRYTKTVHLADDLHEALLKRCKVTGIPIEILASTALRMGMEIKHWIQREEKQ
jgi:hypothetical protein